jgi:autotransporter-associated beta strand protein
LAKWVLRGNPAANQQGYYLLVGQGGSTYEIGELSSASDSGGGVLGGGYTVSTTWQIGGLNTSSTFRGTIQNGYNGIGAVSVTKVGSGTLTLTGTNYYTGATTVSAGTLLVNSPGTLASGSAVTVNGGALGGTGTIGGSVTVAAGGSMAPGASAGTLSTGSLNVSAMADGGSGKLNFELGADTASSDQIAVTGTLTIGSDVLGLDDFTFTNLGGLASGTYTLITTTAGISGTLDAGNLTGTILTGFTGTLQTSGNNLELVVSSGTTSPYDTWANGTFVPPLTQKLPGDNQDGDSLDNLQEFAFGTNPTVSTGEIAYSGGTLTTPGAPKIVAADGSYSIVFGRRADYVAAGLTYTVQFSAGLDTWVDNNDGTNPFVQIATDGTINAMSVPFVDFISTPSGMQKPTFARVKVEMAD